MTRVTAVPPAQGTGEPGEPLRVNNTSNRQKGDEMNTVIKRGNKILTCRKGTPQSVIDGLFKQSDEIDKKREEAEKKPMTKQERAFLERMSS